MAADAIVIKIKFAKSFGELNARMERGNDQQNIRVVGLGEIVDLDAKGMGDWSIQFCIGIFFNPSGASF